MNCGNYWNLARDVFLYFNSDFSSPVCHSNIVLAYTWVLPLQRMLDRKIFILRGVKLTVTVFVDKSCLPRSATNVICLSEDSPSECDLPTSQRRLLRQSIQV